MANKDDADPSEADSDYLSEPRPERHAATAASPCRDQCDPPGPAPPIPPDGGYGWVVCAASFMASLILDGVCFSFGIFYMEFLDYYGDSKAKTSWVGSVLNGMYLSMGPLVGGLTNKFGCRSIAIVGSVMAAASFFLSTFSPNMDILIFTYGGLGGFGFGLMYLPAIVMVGFYFEKRRALATGIAVCGSGIGAFVFAPLCEKLLDFYDWKGATWIISGIVLNGCVLGALYRPLEPSKVTAKSASSDSCHAEHPPLEQGKMTDNCDTQHNTPHTVVTRTSKDLQPKDVLKEKMKSMGNGHVATCGHSQQRQSSLDNLSPAHLDAHDNGLSSQCHSRSCCDITLNKMKEDYDKQLAEDLKRPMYRKDIFYSGSVDQLNVYRDSGGQGAYVRSVTSIPSSGHSSGGGGRPGLVHACVRRCRSLTDTVGEMMDFSLLLDPVFCVYGMSCFLCMAGFYIPFTYLPHHAVKSGLSREQAAFLLSIIGIANTVARVLCGWVSDQPWADCLIINNIALILGGVATILCPFCFNYGLLATYSAVFGSGIAVFVSLRSIIMVELMGLDRLTNAFGLVTMCQGLSAFIGAPIAGALFNVMGSYNLSFYMAGTSLAMAGAINLPLRRLAAWQKRKRAEKAALTGNQEELTLVLENKDQTAAVA